MPLVDYNDLLRRPRRRLLEDLRRHEKLRERTDHDPGPPMTQAYAVSASNTFLLLVTGGAIAGVVCGVHTCAVRDECTRAGTCVAADEHYCGFRNVASFVDDLLGSDASSGESSSGESPSASSATAQTALLRGACAPGERAQRHPQTGIVECVPFYPFPSALNTEIMDPAASSPHMRACGKWIEAGGVNLGPRPEPRAWSHNDEWVRALKHAEERATASSLSASDAASKFRAECERTVLSGTPAVRNAAVMAYQRLSGPVRAAADRAALLRASGNLAGHYCDSSVRIGTHLDGVTGRFHTWMHDGWLFAPGVLARALSHVGEPVALQDEAEVASATVRDSYNRSKADALSEPEVAEVLVGATDGYDMAPHVPDPLPELRLLGAVAALFDADPERARSYVRGIAAYCSYSMLVQIDPSASLGSYSTVLARERAALRQGRPPAAALGRLRAADEADARVDSASIINASTITFSQLDLQASSASGTQCLHFMRFMFPEHVDQARFDATITPTLYRRLHALYLALRASVSVQARLPPVAAVLDDAAAVSDAIAAAKVRIVGAPRGSDSWAGIARPLPQPGIASDDGLFVQALKQARAVFNDRVVELAAKGADPCDHPPMYDATVVGAYTYYQLGCAVILLGMAHRPWMDAQHDDASLLSRGLAIAGHELGHATLRTAWKGAELSDLLQSYREETYVEAIADVLGVMGVIGTGLVSRDEAVTQWCQSWCARLPVGYVPNPESIHPYSNERCDALHDTILRHVAQVG